VSVKKVRSTTEIPKTAVPITCRAAAELLEMSMGWVRQMVRDDKLDGWKIGESRSLLLDQRQVLKMAVEVAGQRKNGKRRGRPARGYSAN
jgi:hypothetical protein